MRWIKKKALRLAFGLLLIAGLLYRLGPFEVAHTILSARPGHVLIAVSVYAVTFLILSTRWRMILHDMGESMPLTSAYKAFAGGMILSDLTPGRIGEISRPFLIRDKVDLSRGISSVVIDRFADILTIFLLGASGLLLFFRQSKYAMIIISMFLLAALTAAAIWRWRRAIPDRLRSSSPRIAPVAQLFESLDFIDDIRAVLIRSVLLTIIAWATHALRVYMIATSVGQYPSIQMLFFLLPLVSALSLVPVSISGLGLVEGGLAALLATQGVPPSTGLSIAFMDRVVTVMFHILTGWRTACKAL